MAKKKVKPEKKEVTKNKRVGKPRGDKKGSKYVSKKPNKPAGRPFTPFNQFWRERLSQPARMYEPHELAEKFAEYVSWNKTENVFLKAESIKSGEFTGQLVHTPTIPPLTAVGFCNYCGMLQSTYIGYKKDVRYMQVCESIDQAIYQNKFDGAATGMFNHAIIARDLGLADKKDITSNGQALTNSPPVINVYNGEAPPLASEEIDEEKPKTE